MSAKFLGIGLLSLGGLMVGTAGGYLAVRTDVPAPTEVVAAPIPPPITEAPAAADATKPADSPATVTPVSPVESKPISRPVRTRVSQPVAAAPPARPATDPGTESVAATTPAPVFTATPAPVSDPPATTVVPAEPRYVTEPPLSTGATQEARRAEFDEVTVARHSVIGIRLDAPVSTRTARVEDRVTATVSRDVTVAGRTAIAAGVRLEGSVVLVERGGRFKNRPRLGLQFDRMILADGTRVSIKTDTIYREGDSPSADATAKVGTGAVAGAILGAVIGGKKGAVIGTAAGAAGGVATVMRGDGDEASMAGGAPLTVRLTEHVAVLINR